MTRMCNQVGRFAAATSIFCLSVSFGIANPGQIPGLRDEAGPWPSAPDGYVWPEPTQQSPSELLGEVIPTAELRAEIGESALNDVESSWVDETLHVVRIDMNDDGVAELFVHDRSLSGTGGRLFVLFHLRDGEWRAISNTLGWIALLDSVDGWRRYSALASGGGGHLGRALLQYCDGSYRVVRMERWDSRAPNVTVTTTRCEDALTTFGQN